MTFPNAKASCLRSVHHLLSSAGMHSATSICTLVSLLLLELPSTAFGQDSQAPGTAEQAFEAVRDGMEHCSSLRELLGLSRPPADRLIEPLRYCRRAVAFGADSIDQAVPDRVAPERAVTEAWQHTDRVVVLSESASTVVLQLQGLVPVLDVDRFRTGARRIDLMIVVRQLPPDSRWVLVHVVSPTNSGSISGLESRLRPARYPTDLIRCVQRADRCIASCGSLNSESVHAAQNCADQTARSLK